MKRNTRIIAFILCLAVVFLVAGCGSTNKEETPQQSVQTESVPQAEDPSAEEPASQQDSEEPEVDEPENDDSVYIPGERKEKSYICNMLGLKFKLPKDWSFYTKKELAKLNKSDKEPSVEEIVSGMEKNGFWYEMFAQADSGENITILVEKNEGLQDYIESKGIKNIVADMKDSVKDSLKEVGAKKIKVKSVDREFPLEDYAALKITMKLNDVKVTQYQFVKGAGDYMYSITITCLNKDSSKKLIKKFSSVR